MASPKRPQSLPGPRVGRRGPSQLEAHRGLRLHGQLHRSPLGSDLIFSKIKTLDATISSKILTASLIPPHLANEFLEEASNLGTANSFPLAVNSLAQSPQITRLDIDVAIGATRRSISECQARFTSAVGSSFMVLCSLSPSLTHAPLSPCSRHSPRLPIKYRPHPMAYNRLCPFQRAVPSVRPRRGRVHASRVRRGRPRAGRLHPPRGETRFEAH